MVPTASEHPVTGGMQEGGVDVIQDVGEVGN